jgi:hypothetical protein
VRIVVSRKKWFKAKGLLAMLHELVLALEWVDHKVLEIIRGFMVYVDCTYKPLTPFLMGIHMSIEGWRPGRYDEDWRLRQTQVEASRDSDEEGDDEGLNPSGTSISAILTSKSFRADRVSEILTDSLEATNA